jgi:hypothetical protein
VGAARWAANETERRSTRSPLLFVRIGCVPGGLEADALGIRVYTVEVPPLAADGLGVWGHKRSVAEQPLLQVGETSGRLAALDVHILRILDAAGTGQSLRHARRAAGDLAIMLVASGTSTFAEFDLSLERLEAQGMIDLDQDGVVCLSERGRERIDSLEPPVERPVAFSPPVPASI